MSTAGDIVGKGKDLVIIKSFKATIQMLQNLFSLSHISRAAAAAPAAAIYNVWAKSLLLS